MKKQFFNSKIMKNDYKLRVLGCGKRSMPFWKFARIGAFPAVTLEENFWHFPYIGDPSWIAAAVQGDQLAAPRFTPGVPIHGP
jgi:hypothetical protein